MKLLLRAELKKLARSLGVVGVVLLFIGIFGLYQTRAYSSVSSFQHTVQQMEDILEGAQDDCPEDRREVRPIGPGGCYELTPEQREGRLYQLRTFRERIVVGETQLTPAGGVPVVLGLLSSAIGIAMALLLTATGVGMELTNGTLRGSLMRQPSRLRFLLSKCSALLGLGAGIALASIGVLALMNWIHGLLTAAPGGAGVPWQALALPPMWIQIGMPLLVLALFIAMGTAFALGLRSPVAAIAGPGALLLVDAVVARSWTVVAPYTMTFNIHSLGRGFQEDAANALTTIWVWTAEFPGVQKSITWSLLALLVVLALSAGAAFFIFQRQEIR